jgi:hypothetical protein
MSDAVLSSTNEERKRISEKSVGGNSSQEVDLNGWVWKARIMAPDMSGPRL